MNESDISCLYEEHIVIVRITSRIYEGAIFHYNIHVAKKTKYLCKIRLIIITYKQKLLTHLHVLLYHKLMLRFEDLWLYVHFQQLLIK